ncbi:adenosine deaminase [Amycolatopsis carbonis]|uniref:Adenine deaminase n=1 Tax=Amycolatopsis carbonis TaxID=715471 RepID=A0A9Y2I8W2_9PSEU|nr:adenosine deaminase [Amycolatopsis sp. 2-15]WIX75965.1 adenosine deaminase [Amycolatopsis sp. 2-15]
MTARPKAELHVHLEGTLEPEDMVRFAARNGVELPWQGPEELRAAYSFTGLENFLSVYFQGCQVLCIREDFRELTVAYLQRAAGQGVRRAEMLFGPQAFLDRGIAIGDQIGGIVDGIDEARETHGIDGALLVSAHRHRSEDDALELLELVRPWRDRVVGVGLGGAERGNPPSKFARYFDAARADGYRTTCHAGEEGPAAYVAAALDECHVERIDHGYAAATNPDLVARLADDQVTLTMCPLSNLRLHVTDDLTTYPVKRLLDAGVPVTVNSDDPAYFGGYVNENYAAVTDALGLTEAEVKTLVRNSFSGSFAHPDELRGALEELSD